MFPGGIPEAPGAPSTTWDVPLAVDNSDADKGGKQATASSADERPHVSTSTAANGGKQDLSFNSF